VGRASRLQLSPVVKHHDQVEGVVSSVDREYSVRAARPEIPVMRIKKTVSDGMTRRCRRSVANALHALSLSRHAEPGRRHLCAYMSIANQDQAAFNNRLFMKIPTMTQQSRICVAVSASLFCRRSDNGWQWMHSF
jgi:hypothetical protein